MIVVHTNRLLRERRQQGLAGFQRGSVTIDDMEGLEMAAEFASLYLCPESKHGQRGVLTAIGVAAKRVRRRELLPLNIH